MALNLVWSAAILAVAAIAIGAAIRVVLSSLRSKDYPPGPPTFPIIGNLHQIPLKKPFLKFHEWADTYGDIIGLKVGPANLVIIHSPELVRELFDKRGPAYSGRPYSYIPNEHVLGEHVDKHIISLQHGPVLRRWRSAVAPLLGPTGLRQTLPMQEATAAILLQQLLMSTSSDLFEHFRHWALATPLLAIAGQRLERHDKDFSDRYFNAQHLWLQLLEPGNAPPVDFLPFLRWVPECYADWKTKARTVREFMREEYSSFLRTAQSLCTVTGGPTDFKCLMTKLIEEDPEKKKGAQPFTPEEVAYLGGGLIDAAVDTTYATVMSFLLFIAAHPAIQAKARDEIDRVSADKPPSGDNIAQLPYLRACLLEIFRLRPPAPNGLPHVLDREDTFRGYRLPEGTTLLTNVWGIQRNPDDYERPEEFYPERFLQHPMGLKAGADESVDGRRVTYTFGAGRRVCPGDQFAQNSLLVVLSKLLWAFEIVALGELDTSVETGYHAGLVLGPKQFDVSFVLRNEKRREAIMEDYETSSFMLDQNGL